MYQIGLLFLVGLAQKSRFSKKYRHISYKVKEIIDKVQLGHVVIFAHYSVSILTHE